MSKHKIHGGVAPKGTKGGGPNGPQGHSNSAKQEMLEEMRIEERHRMVKEMRIKDREEKAKRDKVAIELDSRKDGNSKPMLAARNERMLGKTVRVVKGKIRQKF